MRLNSFMHYGDCSKVKLIGKGDHRDACVKRVCMTLKLNGWYWRNTKSKSRFGVIVHLITHFQNITPILSMKYLAPLLDRYIFDGSPWYTRKNFMQTVIIRK